MKAEQLLQMIEDVIVIERSQARREALEEAIAACRKQQEGFLSPEYATNQPFSSHGERFGCGSCITAIRALMERED